MNTDERHEMREQHRAEILAPIERTIYCENCHDELGNDYARFNHYKFYGGVFVKVERVCCHKCIDEVVSYRYNMRKVAEMTKELVKRVDDANYQRVHMQEYDKLPGRVKHI